MKVLTVNCYFPVYSTGRLIYSIEKELNKDGVFFFHCYETGKKVAYDNTLCLSGWLEYRIYYWWARISGNRYGTGFGSTKRLLAKIKKWSPDIVHIHCPNASSVNLYALFNFLRINGIATVITHHAEFFYTGNCPHANDCTQYMEGCSNCPDYKSATESIIFNRTAKAWKQMYEALDSECISSVCVSPWQAGRCSESVICKKHKVHVIPNGVDTKHIHYVSDVKDIIEKYGLEKKKILLHVTASFSDSENSQKGGNEILKLADKFREREDVIIVVVGPHFLHKEDSIKQNIVYVGEVKDSLSLSKWYSIANLTVVVSKRETFGLVCAESMCCGTPVVGYRCGGTETIALEEYSEFTEWGNIEELYKISARWIGVKCDVSTKDLRIKAEEKYSIQSMCKQYLRLYNNVLAEKGAYENCVDN